MNYDDDVLTLAHFPAILPVLTKQAVTKRLPSRWEKINEYELARTAVPYQSVWERVLTSCHPVSSATNNTRNIHTHRSICTLEKKKRKKKKEKDEEG